MAEKKAVLGLARDIGFDPDQRTVRAGMEDFRTTQMAREGGGKREHRGQMEILEIFRVMGVLPENPSPATTETTTACWWKSERLMLAATVEPVDDRAQDLRFVGDLFGRGSPNTNDEVSVVGINRTALERLDPFLDHGHRLQKLGVLGGGVVPAYAPEFFLFPTDDLFFVGRGKD